MNKITLASVIMFSAAALALGEVKVGISGAVEWDKMEINAAVSLNLASANIKLPAGRTQGEELINAEYLRMVRPGILNLRVDSSSTVADLIARGEWSFIEAERFALGARIVPPALSPDLRELSSAYSLKLEGISAALLRHNRPAEIMRTLSPAASADYTGIIIIASENLPVHGMRGGTGGESNSAALTEPCLFPKIWDTDMNLVFERGMMELTGATMIRYAPARSIFNTGPSGLSPEISALVGSKPLRIFARGVFGIHPTDPIIDRQDALLIISSEANRRLLREGRLIIILDDSKLKTPIGE
jgi:hypothetical protein